MGSGIGLMNGMSLKEIDMRYRRGGRRRLGRRGRSRRRMRSPRRRIGFRM